MAESIKDKVAIVGMGCTPFGEHWNLDIRDLITQAALEACEDAGVGLKDVQAIWLGTFWGSQVSEGGAATGMLVSSTLQTQYIPVTRVENACATGLEALRGATYALAAKAYDLVLVIGVEKLKDTGFGGLGPLFPGRLEPVYGAFSTAPGRYAMAATAYFAKYGLSPQEGKRLLAEISVKSHYYGARNPKAHLRREITVEQVMTAPMIAWPLGLYDCCGVTDGASAAILCRSEDAKLYRPDYATIKGFGIGASPGWGKEREDYDFTYWDATEAAARQAYAEAGIKDPPEGAGPGGAPRLLLHRRAHRHRVPLPLRPGQIPGADSPAPGLLPSGGDAYQHQRGAQVLRPSHWGQRLSGGL